MLKKINKIIILSVLAVTLQGCFKEKPLTIIKESETFNGAEINNDLNFNTSQYIIDNKKIPYIDDLKKDNDVFSSFYNLNLNNPDELNNFKFDLSNKNIKEYENILSGIKKIETQIENRKLKVQLSVEKDLAHDEEAYSRAIREMTVYENFIDRYYKNINPLITEKELIEKELEASKELMKENNKELLNIVNNILDINDLPTIKNENHFEIFIESQFCDNSLEINATTINFYKVSGGTCYMAFIPVPKDMAFMFTKDEETFKKIKEKLLFNFIESGKQGFINSDNNKKIELQNIKDEIRKKEDEAYHKFGKTTNELKIKKEFIENNIKEKENTMKSENIKKDAKILSKIEKVDFNEYKELMTEPQLDYMDRISRKIFTNAVNTERKSFNIIILPEVKNDSKNEYFVVVDTFKEGSNKNIDAFVIDLSKMYKNTDFINQYKEEGIPSDVVVKTPYVTRIIGNENNIGTYANIGLEIYKYIEKK